MRMLKKTSENQTLLILLPISLTTGDLAIEAHLTVVEILQPVDNRYNTQSHTIPDSTHSSVT